MSDQALGPGPPPAMKVPCRGGGKEGPAKTATSPSSAGAAGGDGEWTDCEIRSVASSISDPFSINDMEDDDVMMRPDRALVYISSSPWTEQGWRLYHHDGEEEAEEEGAMEVDGSMSGPFLQPTTLGQALDLTEQCVLITEVNYPYPIVHANSAFTRLSQYHFHEIARQPCFFLQGPGGQQTAFREMLEDVAVTGFGRCSVVHHTRRAEPFLNSLTVVPVVNRSYSIPRMTHLLWTSRATFQNSCRPPRYPVPPKKKEGPSNPAPVDSSSATMGPSVRCGRKRRRCQVEEGAAAAAARLSQGGQEAPLRRPHLSTSGSSSSLAVSDRSSIANLTSLGGSDVAAELGGVGAAASIQPSSGVLSWPAAASLQVICI